MRVARAVFAFTVLVIVGVRCGAQACCVVSDSEVEASARTRSVRTVNPATASLPVKCGSSPADHTASVPLARSARCARRIPAGGGCGRARGGPFIEGCSCDAVDVRGARIRSIPGRCIALEALATRVDVLER